MLCRDAVALPALPLSASRASITTSAHLHTHSIAICALRSPMAPVVTRDSSRPRPTDTKRTRREQSIDRTDRVTAPRPRDVPPRGRTNTHTPRRARARRPPRRSRAPRASTTGVILTLHRSRPVAESPTRSHWWRSRPPDRRSRDAPVASLRARRRVDRATATRDIACVRSVRLIRESGRGATRGEAFIHSFTHRSWGRRRRASW